MHWHDFLFLFTGFCEYCCKTLSCKTALMRHQKYSCAVITPTVPTLKCPYCVSVFRRPDSLRNHVLTCHCSWKCLPTHFCRDWFFFLCRNDCGCQINAKEKKVVDLLKAKNEWSKERNVTDEMVFWVVSWCRDCYIDSVDLHGITFEVTASPSLFWCTIGDFFSVIDFSFLLKSFCSEWN